MVCANVGHAFATSIPAAVSRPPRVLPSAAPRNRRLVVDLFETQVSPLPAIAHNGAGEISAFSLTGVFFESNIAAMNDISPLYGSLFRADPHIVRSRQIDIRQIARNIHALETILFPDRGLKDDVVLVQKNILQAFQVRFKADRG